MGLIQSRKHPTSARLSGDGRTVDGPGRLPSARRDGAREKGQRPGREDCIPMSSVSEELKLSPEVSLL